MKLITENEFKNEIENGIVVVDFFAPWCSPCKAMAAYLEKIQDDYTDIKFVKIDTDECDSITSTYQVRSLPTLIFFKNGVEFDRLVGFSSKSVDNMIGKVLA